MAREIIHEQRDGLRGGPVDRWVNRDGTKGKTKVLDKITRWAD